MGGGQPAYFRPAGMPGYDADDRWQIRATQTQVAAGHAADEESAAGNVMKGRPACSRTNLETHPRHETRPGLRGWGFCRGPTVCCHTGNPGRLRGSLLTHL